MILTWWNDLSMEAKIVWSGVVFSVLTTLLTPFIFGMPECIAAHSLIAAATVGVGALIAKLANLRVPKEAYLA